MEFVLKKLFMPGLIALGATVLALVARSIIFGILRRWAKKTVSKIDDIVVEAFRTPSIFWAIAIGIYSGVAFSDLPERQIFYISRVIHILIVFSVTIVTANLSVTLFRNYVQYSDLPLPTTGLAYGTLRGIILVIGFLIILSILGISIAPVITALGVGGLAAALALQDTLANLFAGINILVEQSIRVGDFVRLESGQEGHIEDISWRTTAIRTLANNMVLIPNSKLAQSVLTNYSLPEKRMGMSVVVSLPYSVDPDRMEKVLTEVASKSAGEISGMLITPAPSVALNPGFGQSSLDFTVGFQIAEFTDQFRVQHELRKRILNRLQQEGIEMPYPTRTVYLKKEEGQRPKGQ